MNTARMPVAASAAVADLLTGPRREAAVLAVFPAAVYLDTDAAMVALVARDGIHQPHACVLPVATAQAPFATVRRGQRFTVGHGTVEGPLRLRVARWWNPVPTLPRTSTAQLRRRADVVAAQLEAHELAELAADLAAALGADDAAAACDLTDRLIGWGPGLTPAGDDVLAGLLAGARLLPVTVEAPPPSALDGVGRHIVERSAGRTTRLSMALLDHARRGEVAVPAADVLRALVGRGDLTAAVAALLRVGATSGHDLAVGLVASARLAAAAARTQRTP